MESKRKEEQEEEREREEMERKFGWDIKRVSDVCVRLASVLVHQWLVLLRVVESVYPQKGFFDRASFLALRTIVFQL